MVAPLFIENTCRRDRGTLYAVRSHSLQETRSHAALAGATKRRQHIMCGYVAFFAPSEVPCHGCRHPDYALSRNTPATHRRARFIAATADLSAPGNPTIYLDEFV